MIPPDGGDAIIEAVLFDMGGVLIELGSLPELLGTTCSEAEFWPQWLESSAVQEFERGHCSPDDFARRAVVDLNLNINAETFLANFARFPRGLYPGAQDLVADVAEVAMVAVLSNTNDLHWRTQPASTVVRGLFPTAYLSYQIGAVKPEPAIFAHALADLDLPGDRVLFIDDNLINVEGARLAGLRAEVAKGPEQARQVLVSSGVLS